MSDLAELERRISVALSRIGAGLDRAAANSRTMTESDTSAEVIARLSEELDAERAAHAQLAERLRTIQADDSETQEFAGAEDAPDMRAAEMTRQLDVQGLELHRMKTSMIQMRETLRTLRESRQGEVEPHLINKALLAELEALRAERAAEAAELAEIVAEIAPVLNGGAPGGTEEIADA